MKPVSQKTVREAVQRLKATKGRVSAELLVDAAKNKKHPLHQQFQWDDKKAAYEHRLYIARKLISGVEVSRTINKNIVRSVAYVRDPRLSGKQQGYIEVEEVRTDEELSREVLVYEFSRAAAALRRARDLAAMFQMVKEVDAILIQVDNMNGRIREQLNA